jgi:MoxR-like ATPase
MSWATKKKSLNDGFSLFHELQSSLENSLQGQKRNVEIALATLLSQGHLLIEGPPGSGKTTFAKSLAQIFNGKFSRIQMTPDLLPSEITGSLRLNPREQNLEFRPGPLFANFVLADELNRSSPKTQSALLEAMAERKITIDGQSHSLPHPFFVVATQNPVESEGVFPLIDSQLDRFSAQIIVDYPNKKTEFDIQQSKLNPTDILSSPDTKIGTPFVFEKLTNQVQATHISDALIEYVVHLAHESRQATEILSGLSTRAVSQYFIFLKAFARIQERDFVIPDDVQNTFLNAFAHRITPRDRQSSLTEKQNQLTLILKKTRSPV